MRFWVLFCPAGRLSSSGRPLHAIHPAGRSAGRPGGWSYPGLAPQRYPLA